MFTNKKIMMVATTDNMIWQFLIPHINYLQANGNKVECVCAKTGFWFDELKNKNGFVMHEINFARSPFKFKNFKAYKQLVKLQKENNYDLIYCQQPVGGLMGRLIGKKFKVPVIYTAHGFHFINGGNPIKNFIFKTTEKCLAKYTDSLVTINQDDFNACQDWKAKRKYKISGIGFDINKYNNEPFDKDEFKKSLGIKNQFVILTIAEFSKGKNYETMLKTIAELKNENIKFLVCGRGKLGEKIKKLINKYEIQDKVELLGYRKDINRIMQVSNVFFLPSLREGLCLSIIEALNFGLPVLTSKVRGCKDLVVQNRNGYLADAKDYKEYARLIKKLMKDKKVCERISKNNKLSAEEYSITNVIAQLENIYNNIEFDK